MSTGRFISEDPIKDGLNWYAYCGGNPIMFWDPTGEIRGYEIEMYENSEMAPAAYFYLWKLTYNWWLADTEGERDAIEQKANEFRDLGYTDTGYEGWNERIEKMDKKSQDADLSEEEHYFRNELNIEYEWEDFEKLQERFPDELKWEELPWYKSIYHKFSLTES